MKFKLIENPDTAVVNGIRDRLRAYNMNFWEVQTKPQYALTVREGNCLTGGIIFSFFGEWLEVEFIWVDQDARGRGIGSELLRKVEAYAKDFGCNPAVVNTLSFQAKPFYEKHGYIVMYTQKNYPKTSSRYYLEKDLNQL